MKYLCLIYDDEKIWEKIQPPEYEKVMHEYFDLSADLAKSGKLIAGEALQPIATATTVRVRHGKVSTTDGPFAETKEQLGGFYLIEAQDLNDALQVASRIPSARYGSVEVRPIQDFSKQAEEYESKQAAHA